MYGVWVFVSVLARLVTERITSVKGLSHSDNLQNNLGDTYYAEAAWAIDRSPLVSAAMTKHQWTMATERPISNACQEIIIALNTHKLLDFISSYCLHSHLPSSLRFEGIWLPRG